MISVQEAYFIDAAGYIIGLIIGLIIGRIFGER